MGFGLDADNTLDVANHEVVARGVVLWCKLLNDGSLGESHIVFICRNDVVRILLSGLLNHSEEAAWHFLSIDDEGTTENLVTAMLTIDLCKAKHFGVCQLATELLFYLMEIFNLFLAQCQSFFLVVSLEVLYHADRSRLDVDGKDVLVESVIQALKHGVMVGILACYGEVFLDASYALDVHVLRNLNGIRAPRGHHFAARSDEVACKALFFQCRCFSVEPAKFVYILSTKCLSCLCGNNTLLGCLKEDYLHIYIK